MRYCDKLMSAGNFDLIRKLKVAFFQKVQCVFHIAKKHIPNHYPELEIEFPAHNSKQLIQISCAG